MIINQNKFGGWSGRDEVIHVRGDGAVGDVSAMMTDGEWAKIGDFWMT